MSRDKSSDRSIRGQLRSVIPQRNQIKNYPAVMRLGEDGVTHINIWHNGVNRVGRDLSYGSKALLEHPIFGNFNSLSHFWKWLQCESRDDRLRDIPSNLLYDAAASLKTARVPNFSALILDAIWHRTKDNRSLCNAIANSTLPFDCYRTDRQTLIRTRPAYFHWFIEGIEEIRKAIKENRDPNFTPWMDDKENDLYCHEIPPSAPIWLDPEDEGNDVVGEDVPNDDGYVGQDVADNVEQPVETGDSGEDTVDDTGRGLTRPIFLVDEAASA